MNSEFTERRLGEYRYYSPDKYQQEYMDKLNHAFDDLALIVAQCTSTSTEQSLALTYLEASRLLAIKAVYE